MLLSAMVDNTVPSEIIYVEYRGQKGRIRQAAIKGLQRPTAVGLGSYVFRPPRVESWRACRGGLEVAGKDGGVYYK